MDVLIGLALLGAMLYFVFLLTLAAAHRRTRAPGPRCDRCDSALIPLLDASRTYHGEAACGRCGAYHEGVPWPTDGTWYVEVNRPAGSRPEPSVPRGGADT